MGNTAKAAKTTRKPTPPRPVHTFPEREHAEHQRTEACPCGPSVEQWTIDGRTSTRVVHLELTPAEDEPPRAEQVLPGPRATIGVESAP